MKAINTPSQEAITPPWLFHVPTYPGESFGHFLGRFRRANYLSGPQLSALLSVAPHTVTYWEAPSRRRHPTPAHLETLSFMTGVPISHLRQMLLPNAISLHMSTRLCALCYVDAPYHRLSWQDADYSTCDLHQHELLTVCPQCQNVFLLPSCWAIGECEHCRLPFAEMSQYQAL